MRRRLYRLILREPVVISELARQITLVMLLGVILVRPDTPMRVFTAVLILALSALISWSLRGFMLAVADIWNSRETDEDRDEGTAAP